MNSLHSTVVVVTCFTHRRCDGRHAAVHSINASTSCHMEGRNLESSSTQKRFNHDATLIYIRESRTKHPRHSTSSHFRTISWFLATTSHNLLGCIPGLLRFAPQHYNEVSSPPSRCSRLCRQCREPSRKSRSTQAWR